MPYCRRCGTQLEDNQRFCHRCGTPVDPSVQPAQPPPTYQPYPAYQQTPPPPPTQPARPMHKQPIVIATIVLVVILLTAVVIAAFMVVPVNPWGVSNSKSDENPAAKTLNLNFYTNIGQVNVMTLKVGGTRNLLISYQANGSYGVLGGSGDPVAFSFDNQTVGDVLTVDSEVNVVQAAAANSVMAIQIFVDPALQLNLNITSGTGKVSFVADKPTTLQGLNLQSSTGQVETNLQGNITITGDISLQSSTADVNFRSAENGFAGNRTIDLQSSSGSVIADLTQTKTFAGNLQVNAATSTGSVNTGLTIDNTVAAKISSQTASGSIQTNLNNFKGNNTALQSPNYPSTCNIEVNNSVATGNIYIDANYRTNLISS